MTAEQAITEARAKIIWGEPSSSVRGFLVSNGVSDTIADTKISEFIAERSAEIRRLGIRGIFIGVTLIVASGGLVAYWAAAYGASILVGWQFTRAAVTILVLIGFFGVWKLLRGVIYLVAPQSEHKSIPDIEE
jgi:MFS family permease